MENSHIAINIDHFLDDSPSWVIIHLQSLPHKCLRKIFIQEVVFRHYYLAHFFFHGKLSRGAADAQLFHPVLFWTRTIFRNHDHITLWSRRHHPIVLLDPKKQNDVWIGFLSGNFEDNMSGNVLHLCENIISCNQKGRVQKSGRPDKRHTQS